jgi:hypothetical protein
MQIVQTEIAGNKYPILLEECPQISHLSVRINHSAVYPFAFFPNQLPESNTIVCQRCLDACRLEGSKMICCYSIYPKEGPSCSIIVLYFSPLNTLIMRIFLLQPIRLLKIKDTTSQAKYLFSYLQAQFFVSYIIVAFLMYLIVSNCENKGKQTIILA